MRCFINQRFGRLMKFIGIRAGVGVVGFVLGEERADAVEQVFGQLGAGSPICLAGGRIVQNFRIIHFPKFVGFNFKDPA